MINSIPINIKPPLTSPSDIKFYNGIFYIIDEFNHRIVLFDNNWEMIKAIGSKGSGAGEFSYPKALAFDTSGNIFVTDCWNHRVQKFSPEGIFLSAFGKYGNNAGELNEPFGIATGKDNFIYVVDRGNHRVQVFDNKYNSLGFFGGRGGVREEEMAELYDLYDIDDKIVPRELFEYPTTVALGGDGYIFVADSGNHRIKRFDMSGSLSDIFGIRGAGDREFQYPHGISIDEYNNIFISDLNNNRIQRLTSQGEFVSSFDNIEFPSALHAKDGIILIGSILNGNIREVRYTSNTQKTTQKETIQISDKIFSEDAKDEEDIPIKFLRDLITHNPDINTIRSILKYFETHIDNVEQEILSLKDNLISVTIKYIDNKLILDTAALAKKDIGDSGREKGIYQFKDAEIDINRRLTNSYLRYKRLLLKKSEVLNTLTDIHIKENLPDDIITLILTDSISSFKKSCRYTADLFLEKDRYVCDAELRYRDPDSNNEEGWRVFEKEAAKEGILNHILNHICINSKIAIYITYNMILILEKDPSSIYPKTLINSIKSDNLLIEDISNIFRLFNNGWEFMLSSSGRIAHIKNLIEPLKLISSTMLFKDCITEYTLKDIKGVVDIDTTLAILAKEAADIEKTIREKEDERGLITEEIIKIDSILENGIIDKEKEILLNKKLLLLNFNNKLMKKEITALFNRYKGAIVNVVVMLYKQLSIEDDHQKRDEIKKELSAIASHVEDIIAIKSKKECELSNQAGNKKREADDKTSLQDIINARCEIKKIFHAIDFINFSLKNYEEISDNLMVISKRFRPDNNPPNLFNIIYNKRFIKFADKERRVISPVKVLVKDNTIYISEYTECRVKKMTTNGDFLGNIGNGYGNLPGFLNMPAGLAIDKNNILYICDSHNHRIQKFSNDGEFLGGFGRFGKGDGEFNIPCGIYIDNEQHLYITEQGNNRIQKFTINGEHIFSFGRQGNDKGELNGPISILVTDNGNILVNEFVNNRLQLFDKMGESLKIIDNIYIIDIALDNRGYIYAINYIDPYIFIFNNQFELITKIKTEAESGRLYSSCKAIAIAERDLFISDSAAYCVHRYKIHYGEHARAWQL